MVPVDREATEYHEQRRRLEERFVEDEEQRQRSQANNYHYHDEPEDLELDHQRSESGSESGERWFNEHAFNIHRRPTNDIRNYTQHAPHYSWMRCDVC